MPSYLETLYDGLTRSYWGYLWTLPDKRTYWFRVPDQIAEAEHKAQELADRADIDGVYWGFGLGDEAHGPSRRYEKEQVRAIPGIWLDVDVKHPTHSKPNLPPSIDDAKRLAAEMPLPPSMVIESGHGIYALWLFKEPWEFESDAEQAQAAWVVSSWQMASKARAAEQKWDVDTTSDLSRVFRIPGSKNRKDRADVREVVTVENWPDRRYNPSEIEMLVMHTDVRLRGEPVSVHLADEWKPARIEGEDDFLVLFHEHEMFRASWMHKRPDFLDQSLSTYDISLAGIAAKYGWSDERIADLIVSHRERWGDPKKRNERDLRRYVERTIGKVRHQDDVTRRIERIEKGDATAASDGDPLDVARRYWEDLNVHGVIDWFRIIGDRDEFVLVTVKGEVRISADTWGNGLSTARLVMAQSGNAMKMLKPGEWQEKGARLRDLAAVRGEGASVVDDVRAWFSSYITQEHPINRRYQPDDGAELLNDGGVLWVDGVLALKGARLLTHIKASEGETQMTIRELGKLWRRAGGQVNTLRRFGAHPTRVWTMPEDLILEYL